ncbi:MAG: transcriptional regulator, AraC family [Fluviicola sp.]|jgi:AraC-like DNA-binding protein|uniref:AraC family transcriptional regulator n=1 Tax=Fluviicola sp. TaxID=1917219 RepID=UPI00261435D8|nr:helix-turn-helix domain-containing protein [Fluviicola sp.]MDF3027210.1 transcriptional regulator, AraC family [Fluviicola sp.]
MEIPVRQISDTDRIELFNIRTIEALLDGKSINHDLHRHTYFFILAIRNGSGKHEIDFIDYPVGDHMIFILRPGQVHQLNLDKNSRGFLMEFNSEFYFQTDTASKQRFGKATSKSFCSLAQLRFDRLYDILAAIHTEYIHKQAGYSDVIRANMDIFFIEYLRESKSPDQRRITSFSYEQERFEAFQELLETNVVSHIPVIRYAEMLGLSVYQLNRIAKNVAGKTVSELINDQLILESKRSLLATLSQVKDIAYSLGFEDVSYFIRFFKKHTGSSPEAFRNHFK